MVIRDRFHCNMLPFRALNEFAVTHISVKMTFVNLNAVTPGADIAFFAVRQVIKIYCQILLRKCVIL